MPVPRLCTRRFWFCDFCGCPRNVDFNKKHVHRSLALHSSCCKLTQDANLSGLPQPLTASLPISFRCLLCQVPQRPTPQSTASECMWAFYQRTGSKLRFGCPPLKNQYLRQVMVGKESLLYSGSWENGGLLSQGPSSLSGGKPEGFKEKEMGVGRGLSAGTPGVQVVSHTSAWPSTEVLASVAAVFEWSPALSSGTAASFMPEDQGSANLQRK